MFSIRDEVAACAHRLEERLRQVRNDSADGLSSPMMNVYFIILVYPQPFARTNRGKSSNIQLFFSVL
jgi:S-adenosylmethionine:diacylglycerol 3-amino-3-carboxypropyl transferase